MSPHDLVHELEMEMEPLDARLKPIAESKVDIGDPEWVEKLKSMEPLDQAGIRPQAQALLGKVLEAYRRAPEEDRRRIRDLFQRYGAFAWAAALPHRPTTEDRFRQHLLLYAVVDQGTDSRDAVLLLDALLEEAGKAGVEVKPILREVAALASDTDKYGMGSTADQLRRANQTSS